MKKIVPLLFFTLCALINAQEKSAFKTGEWLKFRIHYGILNASYATLHLKSKNIGDTAVYHVVGKGRTTGFASIFFKVDDTFESYFDKANGKPYKFIRDTYEGGYTKDIEIDFDYQEKMAVVTDHKNKKTYNIPVKEDIQDLLSAAYMLRNEVKVDDLSSGETINMDMLFEEDGIYNFQLKYLGKEVIRTKFGKVECLKFRPFVKSGRIFKEQESLTLWVSNDLNKIPIRIKADLAVGSLKADLDGYNGLKNQFKIIMD